MHRLRCLTFELSGRRRQDARPGLATMYRVPPNRAWRPAGGAPLERVVRHHSSSTVVEVDYEPLARRAVASMLYGAALSRRAYCCRPEAQVLNPRRVQQTDSDALRWARLAREALGLELKRRALKVRGPVFFSVSNLHVSFGQRRASAPVASRTYVSSREPNAMAVATAEALRMGTV